MTSPLTPEQHLAFVNKLGRILCEHLDGFCIVGYHPITKERVVFRHAGDPRTNDGLNTLLHAAATFETINIDPPQDGKIYHPD
jgi:hypothetical protein